MSIIMFMFKHKCSNHLAENLINKYITIVIVSDYIA